MIHLAVWLKFTPLRPEFTLMTGFLSPGTLPIIPVSYCFSLI